MAPSRGKSSKPAASAKGGGGKKSKNARGGKVPGSTHKAPQVSADVSFIMSLNNGKHAYILDAATGKNVHTATDSARFDEVVASLVKSGFANRVNTELVTLNTKYPTHGWDKVAKRLHDAEVLPA